MSIGLYTSKIQAEVLQERNNLESSYREYPDVNFYWCMIDLVQSSNYRLERGPEKGYVRGESFFTLVKSALRRYARLRIIKEMGDAVLICGQDFRDILEVCILIDQAASQLAYVAGDDKYPFSVRIGIDFGIAKKIDRRHEDYLGSPIDRLARIMSVRSENSNIYIGEKAYDISAQILEEYKSVIIASSPKLIKLEKSKCLKEPISYRELYIEKKALSDFDDYFSPWKNNSE